VEKVCLSLFLNPVELHLDPPFFEPHASDEVQHGERERERKARITGLPRSVLKVWKARESSLGKNQVASV